MDALDTAAGFMDDLLDFSSDIGEEEDDDDMMMKTNKRPRKALSTLKHNATTTTFDVFDSFPPSPSPFPEFAEEELEWLSNTDAFPTVDTLGDILLNPISSVNHQSPVSVLENSNSSHSTTTSTNSNGSTVTNNNNGNNIMNCCGSLRVPVRARSKRPRTRRRDLQSQESWWVVQENVKGVKSVAVVSKVCIGRKCQHCGAEKTPQWRAGPMGPKTLCNACGVRYKSGRLVPEYRPASSPTFSSELHSNSHRKVMEMRRQKMMSMDIGIVGMGIVN
ncbi:GATA transcription factor 1-like [Mangifera indica]|uniref:GATA transcription factor 1-like n=1 Tax=Mangifera indica TaxID=29780 RepID=UPI001CFB4172|nr:GATA transcription factor 1-like [Mangifera indica]